jgi:NAD(P)-dependent dehydrogenase (short-subunit alcohol dehydrogenase family)
MEASIDLIRGRLIYTGMHKDSNEQALASYISRTPAGRGGQPEEVASMAAFLCSPASSFVNGVIGK